MKTLPNDLYQKHLYPILLSLLCSVGCVFLLQSFFGFTSSLLWFCFLFPVLLLPIHFLSINQRPFLFFPIFLLFSFVIGYFVFKSVGSFDEIFESFDVWYKDEFETALPPQLLLFLPLVLLGLSLFYLLQKNFVTRLITTALQLSAIVLMCIFNYQTGKVSVLCYLSYTMFLVLELVFRIRFYRQGKNDFIRIRAITVRLFPLVLLLMLFPSVLPSSSSPIRWTLVKQIASSISTAAYDLVQFIQQDILNQSSEFSMKFSGYSGSGTLGGELFHKTTDSLLVRSDETLTDSIYLMGNMKNIYTGSAWENDVTLSDEVLAYGDDYLDAAELSYAILREGKFADSDNYYVRNCYEIKFLDYRTTTLFAPSKTRLTNVLSPSNAKYRQNTDGYLFKKQMGEGTHYRVHFIQPNIGSSELNALFKQEPYRYDRSFKESKDFPLFRMYFSNFPEDESFDDIFALRQKDIYSNYLQLPESLPKRVYELAQTITDGFSTPYEKMQALERYLRGLSYTTSPAKLPKEQDLVDYFLFEEKEGYCTYFATALCVMGRCIGIPTRYVQGFCARATNQHGEYYVRSDQAHAWCECYLDGFGFVPLDATPGYEDRRYQPWHKEKEALPEIKATNHPEWWSALGQEPTPALEEEEPQTDGGDWLIALPIFLSACLILLLLFFSYILFCKIRLSRFLENCDREERFFYESNRIFSLMGLLSENRKEKDPFQKQSLFEFTKEFVAQIQKQQADFLKQQEEQRIELDALEEEVLRKTEKRALQKRRQELSSTISSKTQQTEKLYVLANAFCQLYEKIRYGSYNVSKEDCALSIEYKDCLFSLLKKEKGKLLATLYQTGELLRY